jgi:hypothetical protein
MMNVLNNGKSEMEGGSGEMAGGSGRNDAATDEALIAVAQVLTVTPYFYYLFICLSLDSFLL